ncbi:recombinase family protein [Streptomyces gilvifuscus]|uniref:Recombinase family protein n=1 Tax=Streptomyces gilvifuscus TaxID=1550617 RepID=A0ABT5FLG1_9ACTN|nr:recombinase family protein [Streptomyces gilvifuscus]MDC2953351.1 recombinase family protein [Streptomyces gilvifuscus]
MKTSARTRRVGLYIRISDDREGAGLGVKRQEDDCRELAASLGWNVVEVYDDNDMSASSRRKKRKGYHRMLADIQSGHIDAVIAWHPDRMYRQPRELEDLMDLLDDLDVELRTVRAGAIDLTTPDGRMTARIQVAIAKREVEHRAHRIKRKVQQLVEAGKIHNSGHRPFGYDRIYEGTGSRRKIIEDRLNEDEARYVAEWADRALEGETLYSLVVDSVEKGIKTSTGGDFTYQAMRALLRSGRISGRKEHKGVIVGKAVWPGIISVEKSDALRALLDTKTEEYREEHGERLTTALKYPLSGLIRCTCRVPHVIGEPCDCKEQGLKHHRMRVSPRADRPVSIYTCQKDGGGCGARTIQVPDVEKAMETLVFARMEEVEAAVVEDLDDPRPALEEKLGNMEARVAELEVELDEGDRPVKEITASIQRIKGRMAKVQRELAELTVKKNVTDVGAAELRVEWENYSVPRKQAVYRGLIEEILIHPATRPFNVFNPKRIEVRWK